MAPIALAALAAITGGCGLFLPNTPFADLDLSFNIGPGTPAHGATDEPVFTEQALFDNVPGKTGHHAATITAFDDGELLAAWYSYEGPHELSSSAIYAARRAPAANAWTDPELVIDHAEDDGNPVLYSEGDTVWLFHAVVPGGWDTARIELIRSTDRGRTWTPPQVISSALGSNVRCPPLRAANGQLILPAYDDLFGRSLFFESDDGITWNFLAAVASRPENIQPAVVRLQNDRLLAVMRNGGKGYLWVMASDDNGKTWSAPIDSGFPNPGSAVALLRLANGNLVLTFNDSPTERHPLSIALSTDQGQTWPYTRILVDGPDRYAYPAAAQTPDGLIHILYTHARQTIHHITINQAWITTQN